ncbi:hypothetical protein [Haladaptatus sp.]|uniref:hypothetical protein n=1 Tax=Haladaptatus sp. TaxID=1973141 RepID=UPI003C56C6A4
MTEHSEGVPEASEPQREHDRLTLFPAMTERSEGVPEASESQRRRRPSRAVSGDN